MLFSSEVGEELDGMMCLYSVVIASQSGDEKNIRRVHCTTGWW